MSSSKRKPRLSFSKTVHKDKQRSPRINSTPQSQCCSPSPNAVNLTNDNCSTPVTSKKRCYFQEDSPSQDFDVPLSQQIPIPLSQQDPLNCKSTTDVVWKWQSPTTTGDYMKGVSRSKSIRENYERSLLKPQIVRRKEQPSVEIKGFFKFQEELQKLTNEPSSEEIFETCPDAESPEQQYDPINGVYNSSLLFEDDSIISTMAKSNLDDIKNMASTLDEDEENTIVPQIDNSRSTSIKHNDSDKENNFIAGLLDDSDFALMRCSQEVELLVMEENQKPNQPTKLPSPVRCSPPKKNLPAYLKQKETDFDEDFDDSFDDFLLSIPLDDIISSQDSAITIRHNAFHKNNNVSLTRHKSMPLENNRISYQAGFTVSKQRLLTKQAIRTCAEDFGSNSSSISKTSSSSSSTVCSSSSSSYKKCTSTEIEMKRLEARQKLEARRKAALTSKK